MKKETMCQALQLMDSRKGLNGEEWKARYMLLNFLWKLSKGERPSRSVRSDTYKHGEPDLFTEGYKNVRSN